MIHDLFFRRYRQQIYWGDRPTDQMHQLFMQAAHIIFEDLRSKLNFDQTFFQHVHDALVRELGQGRLGRARAYDAMCGEFLIEIYDLWNDSHGTADAFLKTRLSLVELLFRAAEERAALLDTAPSEAASTSRNAAGRARADNATAAVAEAIRELNGRFRQAGMGFHYHNGVLQFARDELTEERTAEPCWSLLRGSTWANVNRELKEALDRSDAQRADAAFYAAKALESAIKIISGERGWTNGAERGASNFIDNLANQKNGRFILPWEAELLKAFFTHVRNPHGHGAGSQPPPFLADYQTDWAIETAMSWIKSLIRRL